MPQLALTLAQQPIENKKLEWLDKSLSDLGASLEGNRLAHGQNATELHNVTVTFPDESQEAAVLEVLGHYGLQ